MKRTNLVLLGISVMALLLSTLPSQSYASSAGDKYPNEQTEKPNSPIPSVEFLDIQTNPPLVIVGETFTVKATVVNNSPNTITYHGACESPISAKFDKNVEIETNLACLALSIIELKPLEKATVEGPGSGILYQASKAGITNATVTFSYETEGQARSISKTFAFTIERASGLALPNFDIAFKLKVGETAISRSENTKILFEKVMEDSRCPTYVVCVWEGQATILVTVIKNNETVNTFNLTSRAGHEDLGTKSFDGYFLRLLKIEPYPTNAQPIKPSEYVATLFVTKSEEPISQRVYIKAIGGKDLTHNQEYNGKLLVSWNLDKERGIIIFIDSEGRREVWNIKPSVANCTNLIAAGECIHSPVIVGGSTLPMGLHLGVDQKNAQLFLRLISKDESKFVFFIRELKILSLHGVLSNKSTVVLEEAQRDGPLLVQKIYPDRIEGLNFIEYPLARVEGIPITLHIGESASNGCTVTLTLLEIHGKTATFLKTVDTNKPCPIC